MYKGKHASSRVIPMIFSVILNQRTPSTLQSSALKITELSAVEVGESRRGLDLLFIDRFPPCTPTLFFH